MSRPYQSWLILDDPAFPNSTPRLVSTQLAVGGLLLCTAGVTGRITHGLGQDLTIPHPTNRGRLTSQVLEVPRFRIHRRSTRSPGCHDPQLDINIESCEVVRRPGTLISATRICTSLSRPFFVLHISAPPRPARRRRQPGPVDPVSTNMSQRELCER